MQFIPPCEKVDPENDKSDYLFFPSRRIKKQLWTAISNRPSGFSPETVWKSETKSLKH
jgi:hypothetical protein